MISIPSGNMDDLGPMSMASSVSDASDLESVSGAGSGSYVSVSPRDASHLMMPPSPKVSHVLKAKQTCILPSESIVFHAHHLSRGFCGKSWNSLYRASQGWMGTALRGLGVISTLMRVRKTWVGMRRTASVRAVTPVRWLPMTPFLLRLLLLCCKVACVARYSCCQFCPCTAGQSSGAESGRYAVGCGT